MKLRLLMVMCVLMGMTASTALADSGSIDTMPVYEVPVPSSSPAATPAPAAEAKATEAPVTEAVAEAATEATAVEASDLNLGNVQVKFLDFPEECPATGCDNDGGGNGGGNGYVCSATITCPGAQVGPWFIEPYQLTCQGMYSCSSTTGAVICDGFGTICFP